MNEKLVVLFSSEMVVRLGIVLTSLTDNEIDSLIEFSSRLIWMRFVP
jgi:hypothetical protein